MKECWKTGKRESISIKDMFQILENVSKCEGHKIIVGTDSFKLGYNFVFASAICVLNSDFYDRRYFYIREKYRDDIYLDLSRRLLKEAEDSIKIAINIKEKLNTANIEIHADINESLNHLSSKYKNMIKGYVTGCGFNVKTKPRSFVASSIADLHTRKA
jgi:hypothetical protein